LVGEGLDIDTEEVGRNANDVIYTAEPDWLLSKCAEHMRECGVKHLPVMSLGNNKLEGIISSSDIVRNI
jgi:CBS domain-containing protein